MSLKKTFIVSIIFFLSMIFLSVDLKDEKPKHKNNNSLAYQIATVDSKKIDGNNISTWYRNNGSFNRNPSTGNWGFEWPKGSDKFARYASGLWMGGVVGNDTLMAIAEYDYEYLPGLIDADGIPKGEADPNYRLYKINAGDSISPDYINWPSNQGAYLQSNGKPYLLGQQTLFCSFTDGYPESHGNNAGSTRPLKAVVLKTTWCYADSTDGPLDNTVFTEYRIINRGNLPWTKFYIALWTDDDLGESGDDAVGCDTNLNLAFTYNSDNNDPSYGVSPPAVGFNFLRGPTIQSSNDTVKYYNPPGSNNRVIKSGHKSLNVSSFNMYVNSDPSVGDPSNYRETYFNLQGIRRNGTVWVNPITGQVTKFSFSGDPESNTGWLETNGGGRRFLQSIGPISVNPSDTQSIIIAQIIARGTNNKNSVTKLKRFAKIIKAFYENNFKREIPNSPVPDVTSYAPGNGNIYLSWNDRAEKISIPNVFSGGTYKFEGYNIYQIKSFATNPSADDTVLIKTFDIQNGITNIRDSVFSNSYEGIVYAIVQRGSDNGIQRTITINRDSISNKNIINGTEYKFLVTAYYYDSLGGIYTLPKVIESSSSNIVKVIPQNISSGTIVPYSFGDTIATDQKEFAVMPIVTDPLRLITATYTSTFGGTNNVPTWTLTKTFGGITSVIFENVTDFTGTQDTAKFVDGFILVHQIVRDSGIVRDPDDAYFRNISRRNPPNKQRAWTYEPNGKEWFTAPDTTAVKSAKIITGRQFESRSLGMSFPTLENFRNLRSRISANGRFFQPVSATSPILTGGPLRKIQIVFGQSSMAYRFVPTDTLLNNTPFVDMVSIPFSVFAADELDSSGGTPRQLNIGFMDKHNDGLWNPDTSSLGNYHFTYIFASDYNSVPNINYTNKNPGFAHPTLGFPAMDIMYAWLPRVKSVNGVPQRWSDGDKLTVSPYRITRPEFVPGYPLKYNWTVKGTENTQPPSTQLANIKAFPNPYFGFSELEYNEAGEKFIYFSHLPERCDIFIYTLDGVLVKRISRNNFDSNNSLEKWDLKNSDGKYVASGMYIVYVDCNEIGAKTLKIAILQNKF